MLLLLLMLLYNVRTTSFLAQTHSNKAHGTRCRPTSLPRALQCWRHFCVTHDACALDMLSVAMTSMMQAKCTSRRMSCVRVCIFGCCCWMLKLFKMCKNVSTKMNSKINFYFHNTSIKLEKLKTHTHTELMTSTLDVVQQQPKMTSRIRFLTRSSTNNDRRIERQIAHNM